MASDTYGTSPFFNQEEQPGNSRNPKLATQDILAGGLQEERYSTRAYVGALLVAALTVATLTIVASHQPREPSPDATTFSEPTKKASVPNGLGQLSVQLIPSGDTAPSASEAPLTTREIAQQSHTQLVLPTQKKLLMTTPRHAAPLPPLPTLTATARRPNKLVQSSTVTAVPTPTKSSAETTTTPVATTSPEKTTTSSPTSTLPTSESPQPTTITQPTTSKLPPDPTHTASTSAEPTPIAQSPPKESSSSPTSPVNLVPVPTPSATG